MVVVKGDHFHADRGLRGCGPRPRAWATGRGTARGMVPRQHCHMLPSSNNATQRIASIVGTRLRQSTCNPSFSPSLGLHERVRERERDREKPKQILEQSPPETAQAHDVHLRAQMSPISTDPAVASECRSSRRRTR